MIKRTPLALVIACALLCAGFASAEEGMWMLHQLPALQGKLRTAGLALSPEEIWDFKTNTGLAAAIPSLGGCSASFVSPDGLIVTNHHCAFSAIQMNSTPEHDYITDGFLAHTRAEELDTKTTRVSVFKGYEDVTAKVLGQLPASLSAEQRSKAIEKIQKELVAECEKDGLRCRFAEMFGGGSYYLFRSLEIRDVRLVCAPPNGVGNFGGEVDNWMWPRHSGDFSFLRAYVGPDGKPADASPNNVPYRPDRWLKVAADGVKEGDFTMIMGYPAKTYRYKTAAQVANDVEFYYPRRIEILGSLIDILENEGKRGKDIEIRLASWLKGLYNSYKNNQGVLAGLRQVDLAGKKLEEEKRLAAWITADLPHRRTFADVLPGLARLQEEKNASRERDLLLSFLPQDRRPTLLNAATIIERWTFERTKPDAERKLDYQARDESTLRQRLVTIQKSLDAPTEHRVLTYLIGCAAKLPAAQRINAVDQLLGTTGQTGDAAIAAAVDRLLAATKLADQSVRLALFDGDHAAVLSSDDPMLKFAAALRSDVEAKEAAERRWDGESTTLVPRLIEALAAWQGDTRYPDANSTLRFTYATVKGYEPRDGVIYKPFTTVRGVMEKNTGVEPFDAPKRLLEAAAAGADARWRDPRLGDVPACFLSTNDITGGNSGSPVMNAHGELVGLAFDGNWESMTSDYQFSSELSRTINVDIRYVLWFLETVDGADELLREMAIPSERR